MRKVWQIVALFWLFLSSAAFADQAMLQPTPVAPISVAVTIPPQRYFVSRLLGENAKVSVLIPAGVDHETYEPSLRQLQSLAHIDALIVLGHPGAIFEAEWLARIEQLRGKEKALKVINPIQNLDILSDDIHYWTSPRLVRHLVGNLGDALSSGFPAERAEIQRRTQELLSELRRLEEDLQKVWEPMKARGVCEFLVFHAAWGYFSRDFGLRQLAFESSGREPNVVTVAKTVREAKAAHVKTLFLEPQIPRDNVEALRQELGVKIAVLDLMSEDWEGNLRRVSETLVEECSRTK